VEVFNPSHRLLAIAMKTNPSGSRIITAAPEQPTLSRFTEVLPEMYSRPGATSTLKCAACDDGLYGFCVGTNLLG
jgi:hypothetical protein